MTVSDLSIRVRAPSRLHFGLLAFGNEAPRQFGGVGVMIDKPLTELVARLRPPNDLPAQPTSDAERRAYQFADQFRNRVDSPGDRDRIDQVEFRVVASAAEHVGLGSGTQLAMSVARTLAAFLGRSDMSQEQLARMVGRGARSAIGVHGFQLGGFIVEGGKTDKNAVSPLVARLNFPDDWHFLLVIDDSKGRHGAAEREAFERLAPMSPDLTATLCRLTLLGMLPAVAERNFASFNESLAEFGRRVGECFALQQGGIFTSPLAGAVLDELARHGMRGVAQSSWGPTLAAVCDSR